MTKRIKLRIANNVDITKVFSASLRGGIRGIDDETMALETYSNEIVPTLTTKTNWTLICESKNKEMEQEQMICAMRGRSDGEWHESEHEQRIECREDGVTNTMTGVSKDNMAIIPNQIIGSMQKNAYKGSVNEVAPTITSACGMGGGQTPMITEVLATTVTTAHHYNGYRVRRLTERELFRLMDVSEEDIDKIQNSGISKTQQQKLAGNSIVVSCMYHIFRKLFVNHQKEESQLNIFDKI